MGEAVADARRRLRCTDKRRSEPKQGPLKPSLSQENEDSSQRSSKDQVESPREANGRLSQERIKDYISNPSQSNDLKVFPIFPSFSDNRDGRDDDDGREGGTRSNRNSGTRGPIKIPSQRNPDTVGTSNDNRNSITSNLARFLSDAGKPIRSTIDPFVSQVEARLATMEGILIRKGFDLRKISSWSNCMTRCLEQTALTTAEQIIGQFYFLFFFFFFFFFFSFFLLYCTSSTAAFF